MFGYRIIDEKGNFVDIFSFSREISNKTVKWYYYSETGYRSGRVIYTNDIDPIRKTINYLENMNQKLYQNKVFNIVTIDLDNIKFDGKLVNEELIVH
jgi:hypothetical protein